MAIDLECVVTCGALGGGALRARSRELDGEVVIALDDHVRRPRRRARWGSFVAGTLQALQDRGAVVPPVELGAFGRAGLGARRSAHG